MRKLSLLFIAVLALMAAPAAQAQVSGPGAVPDPGSTRWDYASTLEEYQSWSMTKKIQIYRQVVADPFYIKWIHTKLTDEQAQDPSLGGFDPYLKWLPLSPYDLLQIDMLVKHYEVAIPKLTDLLYKRWVHLHFDQSPEGEPNGESESPRSSGGSAAVKHEAAPAATVGQNRNSAYLATTGPEKYDGEIQVVVNPNNPN
ncbi:MAG: hypothetical protein LJE95_10345, partial [Acidobacteria bacterium]|nr:hypothetical protein [Acidobacteriota bacterium]